MVSTKEVIAAYLEYKGMTDVIKYSSQIDRPEIYAHEEKLGKDIFHMTSEELFEMIMSFGNNASSSGENRYSMPITTVLHLVSSLRNVFDFYIRNYEVIINPFHDPMWKGKALANKVASYGKDFTFDDFNHIIERIQEEFSGNYSIRADYYECILQLIYNGVFDAQEIAQIKPEDIDFDKRMLRIRGQWMKVSDRCFELIETVTRVTYLPSQLGHYNLVTWQDNWFKYPCKSLKNNPYERYNLMEVGRSINRAIIQGVKKPIGLTFTLRKIFFLGFYNFMINKRGKEEADRIIMADKDVELAAKLKEDVAEYNIPNTVYSVKNELIQLV